MGFQFQFPLSKRAGDGRNQDDVKTATSGTYYWHGMSLKRTCNMAYMLLFILITGRRFTMHASRSQRDCKQLFCTIHYPVNYEGEKIFREKALNIHGMVWPLPKVSNIEE